MDAPALLFLPSSTGSCAVTFDPVSGMFSVIKSPPSCMSAGSCSAAAQPRWCARQKQRLINYEQHLNKCAFISGETRSSVQPCRTTCFSSCTVNTDVLGFLCLHSERTLKDVCAAGVVVAWKPRESVGAPVCREGAEILRPLVEI